LVTQKAAVSVDHELLELVSPLVCLLHGANIAFMNQAGLRMLGLSALPDAVGRSFESFVDKDYQFLLEAGWDLLAAEEFVPLRLRRNDGTLFDAELRVRLLPGGGESFLVEVRDISKFVKSAEALREREARLTGVLRSVAEGIVTIDESGRIESANPAAEKMLGYGAGKMLGMDFTNLMPETQRHRHRQLLAGHLAGKLPNFMGRTVEGEGVRADGSVFAIEIAVSELRHGRNRLFTAILRDISERKENEARIRRLAHHDQLTGLPNRNLLKDRMNHALARVKRHGGRMAVLFVDLDRFKPINDTLGHEAGDQVLKEVASRLVSCVRSSDTVARVGGDEFVVVIEEIMRPAEAGMVARKIVDTLSRPIMVDEHSCAVGASIGIAVFPDDGYTMEEVSKAADIAMYRVKNAGRNGYCFYADGEAVQRGEG
jgi:diguanylate cyclase (GGDEF)-like protein/PAS domain S-box-containing protein